MLVSNSLTAQNAPCFTMGEKSTIPILQMIFALLALSECLPISGGGTPGTLPQPNRTKQDWNQRIANQSKHKELDKVWIPETTDTLEHIKLDSVPNGVKNSKTDTIYSREEKRQLEMVSSSVSPRGFHSEDFNSKHKAKLKSKRKRNYKEVLTQLGESVNAENVTIVIMKNKHEREKRSFTRITMGDLDNRIIPNLAPEVLDIAYTHVVPCVFADRFYCLNGGTCVFVGALDIKTCRCPSGYTGLRCEMIDQEFLLALLTNSLIFN